MAALKSWYQTGTTLYKVQKNLFHNLVLAARHAFLFALDMVEAQELFLRMSMSLAMIFIGFAVDD